jgi:hypothetical protein
MSQTYLDSVLKILPAVQARNIIDILNDLKTTGAITTIEEYQAKLQELSSLVNDKNPKPSFRQIRALIWHLADSDAHNVMAKAAQADLSAIFAQVSEIGEKIDDHHSLIMKSLAADLERGLADQENTIRRLEWLANQNNEFTTAIVNSFTSSSLLRVPRSELGAENLYFDNRTYQNRTEAELPSAVVDEHDQLLQLDTTNDPKVLPISVRMLSDSSSYGTQINTDIDNNILNIIDGTRGTYWTRNVYLADRVPYVNTVLEFDIGIAKDINYVVVEGATEVPFIITNIDGIGPDGHKITLLSSSVEINGYDRINFDRVLVKSIRITFSMKSYIKADYIINNGTSNIWEAIDGSLDEPSSVEALGPLATEVINSPELANLLNIPTNDKSMMDAYLYPFALDNVWFGNSLYEDSGIFVSKPLTGKNFGICGVQSNELVSTSESVSNSIEYEIIKKDISPKYQEVRFPIPYLGQITITSERLILTKRITDTTQNDAGALRFCPYINPNWTLTSGSPIHVYKNGEEISIGVAGGFDIAIGLNATSNAFYWVSTWNDAISDSRDFTHYTLLPQKMWIKIRQPDPTAVYTVDYTIRTSDTYISDNTVWLDKNKTVFLSNAGRVYIRRDNPDINIDSELYLQITMRRNTASHSSTPRLDEYALLGATYYG